MSSVSRARSDAQGKRSAELEDLPDLPLTPREGWTSIISLAVMATTLGVAIDDARWAGFITGSGASQTGFLPVAGVLSVLVGAALAKSRLGRYQLHAAGAAIGAIFLLNAVSASISVAPSIVQRLRDLNLSVSTFVEEVVVLGTRSYETSVFLLVLGALIWGAGQFGAYAVFRRHRPLPPIALMGFVLLVNVSVTVVNEYAHLVVFVAAALVLLVRLNLLDQAREWRSRGMRDVADISSAFLRNGAAFVAIAIIAATTLAANASSAPLARAWSNVDDELLEVGYAINRWMGGVSGSARGPNILFTPSQTLRGVWESSSDPVFTARTSDGNGYRWRGATYDSFDGTTWQQLDRQSILVEQGAELLGRSPDRVSTANGRHEVQVTVVPADYGGDVIVAPESVYRLDQPAEVQVNGPDGPFAAAKLVYGIQPDVGYSVTSLVRDTRGGTELTGNALASAGTTYPAWIQRYLAIRPGALGDVVSDTANEIRNSLPQNKRTPYHLAVAVQDYLHRSGGFQYKTDVRGVCEPGQRRIDCFLETKQGYCEYFATAMAMLMRELGVPARYVLGYLPGREQEDGSYLVDRSAGHAWVEVYFPGYGWVEFDPTPGNEENGQEPAVFREGPANGPRATFRDFAGGGELECETRGNCEEGPVPPAFNPEQPLPVAPTTQDWTPLALVGGAILALFLVAVWMATKRTPTTAPDLAYRGITRMAARLGYGPRPAQTVYEYAAGLGELVPVARDDLGLIATAKVEATYGRRQAGDSMLRTIAGAYRRVRIGLLRLVIRKPKIGLRPRGLRARRPRVS